MSNEKPFKLNMKFGEALRKFTQTDRLEVEEKVAEHEKRRQRVKERIKKAREEIERGAESGKPKFRL